MSFAALAWAGKCKPGSASRKLVLLALADRHNDEVNGAYPSIAWLVEFTDLNRKTVINCLSDLEALKLISDSGERRGDTRQIKLYRLHLETVPETEPFQKRNSTKKVAEQSQKRDTDTVRTAPSEAKASSGKSRTKTKFTLPTDIPAQAWADFEDMRKRIGKPMTDRARELAVNRLREMADDGWPPGDVLNHSTLNSYQGLFPPKDTRHGNHQPATRQGNPLRGSRPSAALDLARRGAAREAAEADFGQDGAFDRGAWPALPAFGSG